MRVKNRNYQCWIQKRCELYSVSQISQRSIDSVGLHLFSSNLHIFNDEKGKNIRR